MGKERKLQASAAEVVDVLDDLHTDECGDESEIGKEVQAAEVVSVSDPIVMVHVQFIEGGIFFIPTVGGVPSPKFYQKDQTIFVDRKIYEQMLTQGLKVRAFAGG